MKKIITIIGARPQIIKSAAISRAIKNHFNSQLEEIVVHTGQHYDKNMSDVFFSEMEIPQPAYNLGVGSGSHAAQTAKMLIGVENILTKENADALLVYGDTNSTLAGSTAAAKLNVPVIHVEAGLRSFNKTMPEEINRVVCDHLSTLLFSPTKKGLKNLINEGFKENNKPPFNADNPKIYHCGDIMYDNSIYYAKKIESKKSIIDELELKDTPFYLCTIHRNNNTDDQERLTQIIEALMEITTLKSTHKIVLPIHPRTKNCIQTNLSETVLNELESNDNIIIIPPQSFFNIIALENNCDLVITDSGGLQKEAYFFEKACIILRSETEWVEIVENGNAIVTDANRNKIVEAVKFFDENKKLTFPLLYGDGKAAEFICEEIIKHI